jgi:hypothetical protein
MRTMAIRLTLRTINGLDGVDVVAASHVDRTAFGGAGQKFCASFKTILATGNVKCLALPHRSPNLNAFAERWIRSVREECLSKLILFGESSLKLTLTEFVDHYHGERNHQVYRQPRRSTRRRGHGSSPTTDRSSSPRISRSSSGSRV